MSPATKTSARAVADLNDGIIVATVEIAAPPERVFRALTTPEELTRWWGSTDAYQTTSWVHELRVGGSWRASGVSASGEPFSVEGEYVALEAPSKIVQTWRADWDDGHTTTITYRITPTSTGTRVTLRHEGFLGRPESCSAHSSGWELVLDWLAGHTQPEAAAPSYFLCRLLAPRPTFAFDMTADEQALMGKHAAYWSEHLADGTAVVFGPVADPKGPWGLGILRVADEAAANAFQARDPVIVAERGFRYETLPMISATLGA